jgi:archaellin
MYSNADNLQKKTVDIYIAPIAGTNGIDLRNRLILGWNTANAGGEKYRLTVRLNEPATIFKGLQRTGDATWEEIRIDASWVLSADDETIAQSRETASESYTFVSDLISANASKTAAIRHAVNSIGDKIEIKVNAKLKNEIE